MTSILVFSPYYLPGFKAGGPIRSISNLVSEYSPFARFYIVTLNRDYLGTPYRHIKPNQWKNTEGATVFYFDLTIMGLFRLFRSIRRLSFSVIYINSFFNPLFSILPLFIFQIIRSCGLSLPLIVVAPRGELNFGALSLKSFKKNLFLLFSRAFRFHGSYRFQSSSLSESRSILTALPYISNSNIVVAPNIGLMNKRAFNPLLSDSFSLRICTLCRICKIKNLAFSLSILSQLDFPVFFDIFGPIDDLDYWLRCQELISLLPSNITVNYHGAILPESVHQQIASYDLFFLPTLGENFGHSIFESLSASTPVVISDQTPWNVVNQTNSGWAIPLNDSYKFISVFNQFYSLGNSDRNVYRQRSYELARLHSQSSLHSYHALFAAN
jgi:glycosyltransferase involved in cell wall biosynthesis